MGGIHRALLDGQVKGGRRTQMPIGKLDKAIGHNFLRPGWR